jgi:hypothetical protein
VAILALEAAVGVGGTTTDTHGALAQIAQAPFGRLLLGSTAIGLAGYALWRFVQAIYNADDHQDDLNGWLARAGALVSGVVYAGLAVSAASLAVRMSGASNGDQQTQDQTAWLMSHPFGLWLVGIVGVVVIGAGLAQFLAAYRASFARHLALDGIAARQRQWVERVGRAGYVARGVVLGISGLFLVVAAREQQPQQARGLGGSLATLAQQPYGPWLLGFVALGLLAYALFLFTQARYRRIHVH